MARELFVIPDRLITACMPGSLRDGCDVLDDLIAFDLFRLPFDEVDLRYVYDNGATKLLFEGLRLCCAPPSESARFYLPFFLPGGAETVRMASATISSPNWPESRSDQTGDVAASLCNFAAIVLIECLAASNTDKKIVNNKRARLGIGAPENRKYSRITYLDLPRQASARPDSDGSEQEPRHVRMHLRRGHPRHQHFGKGNAQVKRIWIAPTFVNVDDDYQPREEYRARIKEVTWPT